jgi:hypothetical protein
MVLFLMKLLIGTSNPPVTSIGVWLQNHAAYLVNPALWNFIGINTIGSDDPTISNEMLQGVIYMGLGQFLESYFKAQQESVKKEFDADYIEKQKEIFED